jgi:hypothetical protein
MAGFASAKSTFGLLPPSSSVTRLSGDAGGRMISLPVSVEPVNAILSMPGWRTRYAPVVGPSPRTMLATPGGKPAAAASRRADRGVAGSGLSRTEQPAPRAGAIQVVIISGSFHGPICPAPPTGSFSE